jgi:L-rhamnose mutarotase
MIRRYIFIPNDNTPKVSEIEGISLEIFEGQGKSLAILEIDENFNSKIKENIIEVLGDVLFLERIYEMNQVNQYNASEGQLKLNIKEKKRFISHLFLQENNELLEEYIQIHARGMAWREITQNMKTVGVLDMELYINGYDAFLLMDTVLDFDIIEKGKLWTTLPREQEWQTYVSKYQRIDPQAKTMEKWKNLRLVKINKIDVF